MTEPWQMTDEEIDKFYAKQRLEEEISVVVSEALGVEYYQTSTITVDHGTFLDVAREVIARLRSYR